MSTPVKVACAIALFVLVVATTAAQPSHASGLWYVATTGSDNNDCATPTTPCASINGALNKPGFVAGDTIRVAVGTYSGTGDEVVLLNKSVNLSGGWNNAFATQTDVSTVDGQQARRGIAIDLSVIAIVDRFTIRNGFAEYDGGGIYNPGGTLTLINSTVTANSSKLGGGGIYSWNGALTVINSTISGNTTGKGKYYSSSGAGGIVATNSTVWLKSTTVANNSELGAWAPSAINVRDPGGVVYLQNTIIADNPPDPVTGKVCGGNIHSVGYNLIDNLSACPVTVASSDLTDTDPKLGPLPNNGGSTLTQALPSDSPALDAGNPAGCAGSNGILTGDQRGYPRAGRCDIGAYEVSIEAGMQLQGSIAPGNIVAYQITLTNQTAHGITEIAVADSLPLSLTYQAESLTATSGVYTATSNLLQWSGELAAHTTTTITFAALVSPDLPACSTIINNATIGGINAGFDVQAQGQAPCVCNLAKTVGIPVLSVGPSGSWDQSLVYDPTILKDGDQYKMWYSGSNGTSTRIGYATSPDGLTWTKHGSNPVLAPSLPWDGSRLFGPTVISDTGIYKMWYAGSDGTTTRIGYATSVDGITWTKHGNSVFDVGLSGTWDDASVSRPSVMKVGSTYHLWYTGSDGVTMRIGHATSSDGVNWSRDPANPALDLGAPGAWDWIDTYAASVVAYGDINLMWYSGSTLPSAYQTGLATSSNPNGNTWARQSGLIAQGAPGSFDSNSADYPAVILEGDQFKIWYSGLNNSGTYNIGYATAQVCSAVPAPAPGNKRAYLPLIFKSVPPAPTCAAYYTDNFSNANSGWYVSDNSNRRYAYVNGEYQIWAKNPNEAWFETPGAKATNFTASVSAHRTSGTSGAYGLLFGINEDWNQFYEVLIDANLFSAWRYDNGWTTLQDWTTSAAIATGTNWNRLKVVRNGSLIAVYINGQLVANLNDGTFTGLRRIGLAAESDATAVDVRFDDFALYPATCGSQAYGSALATPFDLGRPEIHTGPVTPRQRTRR